MKKTKTGKTFLPAKSHLSAVVAGLLAAGAAVADDTQAMVSGLEETLQPAKAIKPTEEALNQAITARKSFGFRSDREYVFELLTNPEGFGALTGALTGGHYATAEEVEELKLRLIVQEDAIALEPELSDDGDFAGMYVDIKGVLNIGYTVNADERVDAIRQKVNLPERVQAFTASRSMIELLNSKERIVKSSQELIAEGIVISKVAIDIANNGLRIGVVDLDPKKQELIVQLFGEVDVFDQPINEVEARSATASPMRAGVRITAAGGTCTDNWKARDRSTGTYVMLTAGHCVPGATGTFGGVVGTAFFQGTTSTGAARQIGVSDQNTWSFPNVNPATGVRSGSGPVDAMRVPYQSGISSFPWLYAYDNANNGVFANGEQARVGKVDGTVVIGTSVCSGGQNSPGDQVGGSNWKNCGSVNNVNVANTFTRRLGSPDFYTVLNTNEGTYTAVRGDSGAPIWRLGYNSSQGWHSVAVGHHSGGPAGSEIFNDIDRVENTLNVDVVAY